MRVVLRARGEVTARTGDEGACDQGAALRARPRLLAPSSRRTNLIEKSDHSERLTPVALLCVLREGAGLADRATYVVDPDGVIQLVEQTCEGVGRNANELVRKIKAAQYVRAHPGEVCPAAWEEGEATLAPSLDLVGKI